MRYFNPTNIGIGAVVAIVIGGILAAKFFFNSSPVVQYENSDQARPQLAISETDFDFGGIKLSDIKTREIKVKNIGVQPLIIYDAITSCDCTFVQFIIGGVASRKFSMRRDLSWRGEIASQETAVVRIIYQPSLMPVKGEVKREIVFKTNDPARPLVNLRFKATVE